MALVKCKICSEMISDLAQNCNYCGSSQSAELIRCVECGNEISSETQGCPYCEGVIGYESSKVMTTTGFNFETHHITKYLNVITTEVVMGTGIFSEFESGLSDFFGSKSNSFSNKLKKS